MLRLCSFESRRQSEMASLIERAGGQATVVASMQEVPLEITPEVDRFLTELESSRIDLLILMTGVGAEALQSAAEPRMPREEFFRRLAQTSILVRGPKPAAVLKKWGVPYDYRVPEPNTWRELLELLDEKRQLAGQTVAIQEYGEPNQLLNHELERRGARLLRVPVYRWTLPADCRPLQDSIQATIHGSFDALLFTSANQIRNVLQIADRMQLRSEWLAAARRLVIASIGPTCSEALREATLEPDVEASPPKMGQLVRSAIDQLRRLDGESSACPTEMPP